MFQNRVVTLASLQKSNKVKLNHPWYCWQHDFYTEIRWEDLNNDSYKERVHPVAIFLITTDAPLTVIDIAYSPS